MGSQRRARPAHLVTAVVVLVVLLVAGVALWRRHDADGGPDVGTSAEDRRPPLGVPPGADVGVEIAKALDKGVPVGKGNFADPFVLLDGDEVYAYATNVQGANIPVSRSVSATEAQYLGDALPTLPAWTHPGAVWAPSVYERADGTYVMFYNSVFGVTGHQCVGRATATAPAGPFVDDTTAPLECPIALGGAIDPSMIVVDGRPWLVYKADGNCCSLPTSIWSVPMSDDLLSLDGQPTQLLTADQPWEGGITEAPEMIEVDGTLYLFYSGNEWSTADYAVGYAVCQSVTGPCTKPQATPFHSSTSDAKGPGGQTFFSVDGHTVMAFHGWLPGHVDTHGGQRRLYLGEVTFDGSAATFTPYG
jgi:hypothetical protein